MKLRALSALALCTVLAGCPDGGAGDAAAIDRDTLTQRQRDSITATLPIPGVSAVGSAMDAADAASARAAQHDSLAGGN